MTTIKPATNLSNIECRKFALEMASTQVAPQRYPPEQSATAARDVVRMAAVYYEWLINGCVPNEVATIVINGTSRRDIERARDEMSRTIANGYTRMENDCI